MRKWYAAAYFADSWKVSSHWTLNYGVRWEPDLAETLTLGYIARYNEQARAAGVRSTVFQRARWASASPAIRIPWQARERTNLGSSRRALDLPGTCSETERRRSELLPASDMTIRTRSTIYGRRSSLPLGPVQQCPIRSLAIRGERQEQASIAPIHSRSSSDQRYRLSHSAISQR
jgi:hypothetical protein